jgi:hypothetical protein
MTRTELERRLDALEHEFAQIRPPAPAVSDDNPFAWFAWLPDEDLMWIEGVIERGDLGIEPTPEERARWLALEADAGFRRMLAGESAESGRQCHF